VGLGAFNDPAITDTIVENIKARLEGRSGSDHELSVTHWDWNIDGTP